MMKLKHALRTMPPNTLGTEHASPDPDALDVTVEPLENALDVLIEDGDDTWQVRIEQQGDEARFHFHGDIGQRILVVAYDGSSATTVHL